MVPGTTSGQILEIRLGSELRLARPIDRVFLLCVLILAFGTLHPATAQATESGGSGWVGVTLSALSKRR